MILVQWFSSERNRSSPVSFYCHFNCIQVKRYIVTRSVSSGPRCYIEHWDEVRHIKKQKQDYIQCTGSAKTLRAVQWGHVEEKNIQRCTVNVNRTSTKCQILYCSLTITCFFSFLSLSRRVLAAWWKSVRQTDRNASASDPRVCTCTKESGPDGAAGRLDAWAEVSSREYATIRAQALCYRDTPALVKGLR